MKNFGILTTMLLGLTVNTTIQAQNVKERVQDHNQIRLDKAMLERDSKELIAFEKNSTAFKNAVNEKSLEEAISYKNTLVMAMKREISQTDAKLKYATREVKQSKRELGTDRREKRRNRRSYSGSLDDKRDMRRDRRNTRDDRRDKRDDQLDKVEIANRLENQKALLAKLSNIRFSSIEAVSKYRITKNILHGFTATLKADLQETKEELVEDKRELREDRRETRDDRAERREK